MPSFRGCLSVAELAARVFFEALLCDRRPAEVAAQPLEPAAIPTQSHPDPA